MAAEEPLEAVVARERESLQSGALELGGAVLGCERVRWEKIGVEPEPGNDGAYRDTRIGDQVLEVDDPQTVRGEASEPIGEKRGVAAAAKGHVPLVVRLGEVLDRQPVSLGEVFLERELGRESKSRLLVAEERDRPAHRLAEHDEHPRVGESFINRRGDGLAAVEVGRCCLQVH